MRKEVRSMNYNKELEFNEKQKVLIGGGLVISTLIGYKVGHKRGDLQIKRGLKTIWREDPEILYRTMSACEKLLGKRIK